VTDLERIEAKRPLTGEVQYESDCCRQAYRDGWDDVYADVVLLARALDWIANKCDVGPEHEAYYACVDKAERILHEVAGGDDAK